MSKRSYERYVSTTPLKTIARIHAIKFWNDQDLELIIYVILCSNPFQSIVVEIQKSTSVPNFILHVSGA